MKEKDFVRKALKIAAKRDPRLEAGGAPTHNKEWFHHLTYAGVDLRLKHGQSRDSERKVVWYKDLVRQLRFVVSSAGLDPADLLANFPKVEQIR